MLSVNILKYADHFVNTVSVSSEFDYLCVDKIMGKLFNVMLGNWEKRMLYDECSIKCGYFIAVKVNLYTTFHMSNESNYLFTIEN